VGTGVLGDGSFPLGLGAEPRWEPGGEAAGSQIYTTVYTDSLQLSNAFFLRRFVAESVLHLLPTSKKTSDLRKSHDPTRPGQGGHVPAAHPWLYATDERTHAHTRFLTDPLFRNYSKLSYSSLRRSPKSKLLGIAVVEHLQVDPPAAEYPPNSPKKHRWPKISRKKIRLAENPPKKSVSRPNIIKKIRLVGLFTGRTGL